VLKYIRATLVVGSLWFWAVCRQQSSLPGVQSALAASSYTFYQAPSFACNPLVSKLSECSDSSYYHSSQTLGASVPFQGETLCTSETTFSFSFPFVSQKLPGGQQGGSFPTGTSLAWPYVSANNCISSKSLDEPQDRGFQKLIQRLFHYLMKTIFMCVSYNC